ncbi:response regulator [Piscinibacter koreensis]|uniref:Response regulator n=1 Tax=Piscinibacter koreensis TaxID=2742824 RepID=A0A7Y6NTD6_9BURK|nr:response regulator [Schlegelella koreensis]
MSQRILVADHNPDVAESALSLLQLGGFEAMAVRSGREAIEAARQFQPHVAMLDICMPDMDGYQAAVALRREHVAPHRLILVAHTALSEPDDIERVRQAGFNFHVVKPLADPLCDLIASFLAEPDHRRDLQRRP